MNPENLLKKIKEVTRDTINYPKHLRWNKTAVSNANALHNTFNPDIFDNALTEEDYLFDYAQLAQHLHQKLEDIKEMLITVGFKPTIMHITDLYEYFEKDRFPRYIFGLMYPLNGVSSTMFPLTVRGVEPSFEPESLEVSKSIEAILESFSAAVITADFQYHISDSTEYALISVFIGARPQVDVDRTMNEFHLPIHYQMLDNVVKNLEAAYKRLDHGVKSDWDSDDADAAGIEA